MTVTTNDHRPSAEDTQPITYVNADGHPIHVVSRPVPVPEFAPEPVRAPSSRYVPTGDVKAQLATGNMFVGVAVLLAIFSILGAKLFDLHPSGYLYGYAWVVIGVATCIGFNTEETYASEAAAWKASSNKMIGAGISVVFTSLVWAYVWFIM